MSSLPSLSSLSGKTLLITGANSGIGFAAAKAAVAAGAARVIVAGRDGARVAAAAAALGPTAVGEVVDVSSLASVDAFVSRISAGTSHIDILINNAGVFVPPHSQTADGFEVTLATNVIGCAALTYALLPQLAAAPAARIITLSSAMINMSSARDIAARLADVGGAREAATTHGIYAQSKVVISLWAQALQRALRAEPATARIQVFSCDPGTVNTGIQHKSSAGLVNNFLSFVFPFIGKTPEAGAVPVLHLASADVPAEQGGAVFTEGPRVRLFKTPAYMDEANRDAAFAAVNAALRGKGRAVPFQ